MLNITFCESTAIIVQRLPLSWASNSTSTAMVSKIFDLVLTEDFDINSLNLHSDIPIPASITDIQDVSVAQNVEATPHNAMISANWLLRPSQA